MSDERLTRVTVPAVDEILGVPFPVLDEGFVRVVDYMGGDASIVQAARVSYGKGTKKLRNDRSLIRYLMRHRHTTPFEMCEIKLHLRMPMDCWRQWIRHRTASVNEYSTRYSEAIDAAQKTPPDAWRQQSVANRQGSGEAMDPGVGEHLSQRERQVQQLARDVYEERLRHGVAREQARKDLPLSTYTEAYWKTDLHNLFHFLALRMAPPAQQEIRRYAQVIGRQIVSLWCPLAWEAFLDYQFHSMDLSRLEQQIIARLNAGDAAGAVKTAEEHGLVTSGPDGLRRNREREELEAKLAALGLAVPW